MLQYSKVVRSRDEWKRKAVERAEEIREHRKAQKRHQRKIAQLKADISALEQAVEEKKQESVLPQRQVLST
jgi:uncharacterized coiled-coil DUF342 family protein